MSFDRSLAFTLSVEGGYVNDPDDHGGATSHGVTQDTYDRYRRSRGQDLQPVTALTHQEMVDCYKSLYWFPSYAPLLLWPGCAAVFDSAVNHGVLRGVKIMQEALGVNPDGIVGPITKAALEKADPLKLVDDILFVRLDLYFRLAKGSQLKFLRGWIKRLLLLRKEARG